MPLYTCQDGRIVQVWAYPSHAIRQYLCNMARDDLLLPHLPAHLFDRARSLAASYENGRDFSMGIWHFPMISCTIVSIRPLFHVFERFGLHEKFLSTCRVFLLSPASCSRAESGVRRGWRRLSHPSESCIVFLDMFPDLCTIAAVKNSSVLHSQEDLCMDSFL